MILHSYIVVGKLVVYYEEQEAIEIGFYRQMLDHVGLCFDWEYCY